MSNSYVTANSQPPPRQRTSEAPAGSTKKGLIGPAVLGWVPDENFGVAGFPLGGGGRTGGTGTCGLTSVVTGGVSVGGMAKTGGGEAGG